MGAAAAAGSVVVQPGPAGAGAGGDGVGDGDDEGLVHKRLKEEDAPVFWQPVVRGEEPFEGPVQPAVS